GNLSGASPTLTATTVADGQTSINYGNDRQQVILSGAITGGYFTLTLNGQVTQPIAYSASAATVQGALEALGTVGVGNVAVAAGANGGIYYVTFRNGLGNRVVSTMTAQSALTGTGAAVFVVKQNTGVPTETITSLALNVGPSLSADVATGTNVLVNGA